MNTLRTKKIYYSNTTLWLFCSALFSIYTIWLSFNGISDWTIRMQEHFWNGMGFLSIFLGIGSVVIWLIKKKMIVAKKAGSGSTILHLRESHISLGWISFAIGLGHSIFFIVNDLGRASRNFTGYISLLIMLWVILSGIAYKHKILKVSTMRSWHLMLACALGIFMLIHI